MKGLARHLLTAAVAGIVFGGLVGACEFLVLRATFSPERQGLAILVLFYAYFWMLGAVLAGFLQGIPARRVTRPVGILASEYGIIVLLGGAASFFFYHVNFSWLPGATSLPCVLANGVLLVLTGLLLRYGLRFASGIPPRVGLAVFALALLLWAGAMGIGLWPSGAPVRLGRAPASSPQQPNVLMICVDTLRSDHLGCYGYSRHTSPVVDRLAAQGIRFSRCIAASSWTRPTVASILTGVFPATHRQYRINSVLSARARVIPDAMRDCGYETAFVSANPLVIRAFGLGKSVDFYKGIAFSIKDRASLNLGLLKLRGLLSRYLTGHERPWLFRKLYNRAELLLATRVLGEVPGSQIDAALINRSILKWLDRSRGRPFFAYLHYMEPHHPYEPRPPFDKEFADPGYSGPRLSSPPGPLLGPERFHPLGEGTPLPQAQQRYLESQYDGEIRSVDALLGELFAALKQRDLFEDTLIVFTADHGEEFFEHGGWMHGHTLYQELIHVPLIIKMPRGENAGLVLDGIIRQVDILPTVLDLIGQQPWPSLQGSSLAPVILSKDTTWAGLWALSDVHVKDEYAAAYIEGSAKIIHQGERDQGWMLFDLARDSGEASSLKEAEPETLDRMRRTLEKRLSYYKSMRWESNQRNLSEEELRELEALGYADR